MNRTTSDRSAGSVSTRMVQWSRSPAAAAIAVAWGFGEATLFFIVPDVWIGGLALFDPRAGLRAVGGAVLGAVIGGILMFGIGARFPPARSADLLDRVPAVSPAMIGQVEDDMRQDGAAAMLRGPLRGTPYKLYARTAGVHHLPLQTFVLWTVPARAVRFLAIALIAAVAAGIARSRFGASVSRIAALYLGAWTTFYIAYFWSHGL